MLVLAVLTFDSLIAYFFRILLDFQSRSFIGITDIFDYY